MLRKCKGCSQPIPPERRKDAKYCSEQCRKDAAWRRFFDKKGVYYQDYRAKHKDELRKYNTEYRRRVRAKAKLVKQDAPKEGNNE